MLDEKRRNEIYNKLQIIKFNFKKLLLCHLKANLFFKLNYDFNYNLTN